ncbi:MAG: hypothetical protein ACJ741_14420 [Pyrinomonadaceae bacterium]
MHGASFVHTYARTHGTRVRLLICATALACLYTGCAAGSRSPDPTRPRAGEQPYPVIFAADNDRRARALGNWATLANASGLAAGATAPELQPITATLRSLPANAAGALRLPLVEIKTTDKAATKASADEATRESLRRFITSVRDLLGVSLDALSLVDIREEAGARVALYQQAPFRFPLRGGYGRVEIRFAPDRTVLALSSTAIPDSTQLSRAIFTARSLAMPADQVAPKLAGRTFTLNTTAGAAETRTIATGETINVRELVVYPTARANDPNTLDLHLAWETAVGAEGDIIVYVDAVTGEVLAATRDLRP